LDFHLLTPDETAIAKAAAIGTFVAVLIRRPPWLEIVTWFLIGQLTSYYWVAAVCLYWMLGPYSYGVVAWSWGAFGHFIWSAAFQTFDRLKNDPLGTVERIWRSFRGNSSGESER